MFRESPAQSGRRSAALLQRRTVAEEVLERLRELLLRGVLRPGSRIDQAELAVSFGVSTVPVREAILRLQAAGLVQVIPHRGVFVTEVSEDELLDIYATRELLEEQSARLAANNLSESDIDVLEGLADAMQSATKKRQLDDLLLLNREFHFTIYRAAERRHLLQLIEQLWDLSTRSAHLQLHAVPERASEVLCEVRAIVSACERKDADALGRLIRGKVHQATVGMRQHMNRPDTGTASPPPTRRSLTQKTARKTVSVKAKTATVSKKKTPAAPAKKPATKKVAKKAKKKATPAAAHSSNRRRGSKVRRGA